MAEFTPITTQEEFNSRISQRLEEARNAERQKYADYETVKKDLETAKEDAQKKDKTITDLQEQLKGSRAELAKTRIALEKGLPIEMSARLTGETEEEIRKDAEMLSALFTRQKDPAPLRDPEPGAGGGKDSALRALLADIKNQ